MPKTIKRRGFLAALLGAPLGAPAGKGRWGGTRVYRASGAGSVAATRAQLERWEQKLRKLLAVTRMTDELRADAEAMTAAVTLAYTQEFPRKRYA